MSNTFNFDDIEKTIKIFNNTKIQTENKFNKIQILSPITDKNAPVNDELSSGKAPREEQL